MSNYRSQYKKVSKTSVSQSVSQPSSAEARCDEVTSRILEVFPGSVVVSRRLHSPAKTDFADGTVSQEGFGF